MNLQKRMQSFSKTFTIEEIRTKITESNINLRKMKRADHSLDKRSLICKGGISKSESIYNISLLCPSLYSHLPHLFHHTANYSTFLQEIKTCSNTKILLPLMASLRQFLSQEIRPIQETLNIEIIKKVVTLIGVPSFAKDCVWIMINLTSECKVKGLLEFGLLEELIKIIYNDDNEEIIDLAI